MANYFYIVLFIKEQNMKKKSIVALALAGCLWMGGGAMAMDVNVDSATKDMPGKAESILLSVPVKTPLIN